MTPHFFADTIVLLGRSLRHISRSPDTIITTVGCCVDRLSPQACAVVGLSWRGWVRFLV